MKVFINGRFLTQPVTGVQRYAHEVVKQMDHLIEDQIRFKNIEFVILSPKKISESIDLKHIKIISKGFFKGHLWEQFELPFYSRKGSLINLCNVAPMFKRNQTVVIHDASVFLKDHNFSFLFKIWYKIIMNLESWFSKSVVTVSNFSKIEIQKFIPFTKNKLHVFYEGVEHIKSRKSDNRILDKYALNEKPYILAVGSMDPRKNFKNLVRAFEMMENPNVNIVIAGGTNPHVFKMDGLEFPENVKYLGYVTDDELKSLYEHADCFIYPSLYEGFGLPPLEAMALGCPVIVSNVASLPEVCGSAALYCDPTSEKNIADKINSIINDQDLRNKYKKLALERSVVFSWKTSAYGILKLICGS